jgi:hypothetical protein
MEGEEARVEREEEEEEGHNDEEPIINEKLLMSK